VSGAASGVGGGRGALAVFAAGVLFSIGLGLAGMTQPAKIIAFLDFFSGAWDPSLMFVMGGAMGVYFVAWRFSMQRDAPWLARTFQRPERTPIDARLVAGAAIFGAGWGLSGYCPGPAITSLASGAAVPAVFVASVLASMWIHETVVAGRSQD